MPTIDIRILEILTSKVCHDLISPIGAVNNGVEFVQEMGLENAGDAVDLIAFSAQQASAKLQAYRMAYGAGGADNSIKPEDVHAAIQNIVGAENKITQDWDKDSSMGLNPATFERPTGFAKILICALLLAMDCLPKGGVLGVEEDGTEKIIVSGAGTDAHVRPGVDKALFLKMPEEQIEPKYVHGYIMGLLAQQYGFKVDLITGEENKVSIVLTLPAQPAPEEE